MNCLFFVFVVCGLAVGSQAVLQRDIQSKANGGCIYGRKTIRLYEEYNPAYNPQDEDAGCIRVLCKNYDDSQVEMQVHSCGATVVDGQRVTALWPGQIYPDCCRKPDYRV
ncbi:Hypothetical protein NTJ_15649 [Nesidiocoris tenuis]|uniref:Single domain-containing protein n=1 Tax=Nesidiocoris tenuis TaxID=355587 RepID=A0ABN7BG20_9HEMI|nr:Hypothetical protein NTJ_15649 [Nesidiocoris tenuis]